MFVITQGPKITIKWKNGEETKEIMKTKEWDRLCMGIYIVIPRRTEESKKVFTKPQYINHYFKQTEPYCLEEISEDEKK